MLPHLDPQDRCSQSVGIAGKHLFFPCTRPFAEFDLATVEGLGHATKAKAFMNALLKLGLARLRVRAGQETVYVLA